MTNLVTRFRRQTGARVALWCILCLVAAAVLAPIIANQVPLLAKIGGEWTSPALRGFDAWDAAWTGGGACLFLLFVLHRVILRRRHPRLILALLGIGVLACGTWTLVIEPENLDVIDFPALEARDGNWCLWAPVAHGWRDQEMRFQARFAAPGRFSDHPLGTDGHARDVLARLLHGARVSLLVGCFAVGLSVVIGTLVGAAAGYAGGRTDALLSWLIQVVMCFPVLFAIMVLQVFLPQGVIWVVLLIALIRWTGSARLMRGEVRRLRGEPFVLAARVQGLSSARIILRHLVPNALAPVLVNATFGVAAAILFESALSFLGLGIPLPAPSWGEMLHQGRQALSTAPHLVMLPGAMIFITVLCFNLAGEGLREALDPRGSRREGVET